MKTIEELKKQHEKETEKLEIELKINSELPKIDGIDWFIHVSPLYGRIAIAKLEYNFYNYGNDKPQLTILDAVAIAKTLPPESITMVRDSCLSFRTTEHVESLPEEKKERWQEETEISPFLVKVSCWQRSTMTISWFTRLSTGVVEISIILPLSNKLGKYDITRRARNRNDESSIIERCSFIPNNNNIYNLFDNDISIAELQRSIRWSSNDNKTPNDFTLYWINLDKKPSNVLSLLEKLA